jgi:hypothetical protein
VKIQTVRDPNRLDYNLIADAHLDAIYGAGMLDNASGSATILEIALKLARTRTRNQLRYIRTRWTGSSSTSMRT